jgi:hypothetical protein
MKVNLILVLITFSVGTMAEVVKMPRYKSGKRIDFESLLIEGEKKKADYAVVTGNLGEDDFGLLKFRENFLDLIAQDTQEEVE